MVNFDTRESILKQWDRWVKYYKAGGGASWPRDAFESLLDHFDERISQVSEASTRPDNADVYVTAAYICPECGGKHFKCPDKSGG